jgi:hypothetical protein
MKAKHVILIVVGIIVLMQVIRIDTVNPVAIPEKDFLNMTQAPPEIAKILTTSCYDCHSHHTLYPWYAQIAPASWFLKKHINEGRKNLNFSTWADYTADKQISKKEDIVEELEEQEMPLKSYTLIHSDAKLTDDSRLALIGWFKQLEKGNVGEGE